MESSNSGYKVLGSSQDTYIWNWPEVAIALRTKLECRLLPKFQMDVRLAWNSTKKALRTTRTKQER